MTFQLIMKKKTVQNQTTAGDGNNIEIAREYKPKNYKPGGRLLLRRQTGNESRSTRRTCKTEVIVHAE